MSHAPCYGAHRINAVVLASLYSIISSVPTAICIWIASLGVIASTGMAQSNDPSRFAPLNSQPSPSPERSPSSTERLDAEPSNDNAQELLQRARQRLLNQEMSPGITIPITPPASRTTPNLVGEDEFETYHLGPGDSVFFNVPQFPELSFQTTLDFQGNVVVPLAGVLPLKGLTIEEARQQIQSELNRFVVNPQVDATLVAQRPVQVTVMGEVAKPGMYPLGAPQLTVALFSAGGITRLADLRTIRIRRTFTDGSIVERDFDLFTPLRDTDAIPVVRLEDGDIIIVPTLNAETIATYDRDLVARSNLGQPQLLLRVLNYSALTGGRSGGGAQINTLTLPSGSTFVDAISAIAPNPDQANTRNIALVRFDPIQGRVVTQELNARAAVLGDQSQNPFLENNDVIVIGRNLIGQVTYIFNTFTQPFRDVLGFILFFESLVNNASDLFGPGDNNNDND